MKVNRSGLARHFGVSLVTIDSWVRNGAPFVQAGGRGAEWTFDTSEVEMWRDGIAEDEPISKKQAISNLVAITAKVELMYFYLWLNPGKTRDQALEIVGKWQKKKPLELKQIINSL